MINLFDIFDNEPIQKRIYSFLHSKDEKYVLAFGYKWKIQQEKACRQRISGLPGRDLKFSPECSLETAPRIWVVEGKNKVAKDVQLLGMVGAGGTKRAIKMTDQRILMWSQCDSSLELLMHRYLKMRGLLTQYSIPVKISDHPDFNKGFAHAYVVESFTNLAKRGIYVYDTKNQDRGGWIYKQNYLFEKEEDRLNEDNWDKAFELLLEDFAKMYVYDIPIYGDSVNYAVVKKETNQQMVNKPCSYQIRYFGFDISMQIPKTNRNKPNENQIAALKRYLVDDAIDIFFHFEFFDKKSDWKNEIEALKKKLEKKYLEKLLNHIEKLLK